MAGKLNKFLMVGFSHWKGLSKENHLASIWQTLPQKASQIMVQLLAFLRGKSLDTFLSQFPVKEFDTDDEYTWDVVGSSRRNITLIEARDESGSPYTAGQIIGAGIKPFFLVFEEDWFANGEVIGGNYNEQYPIRILGDARMEGRYAVYKCELMGGITEGMPYDACKPGDKFSVEYAPVEKELSRKVGDIRFSAPISMRNEFSRIRLQHKVPGSMLNKKLAVGIPMVRDNGQKQVVNMWMHEVQWQFEMQWSDYKNNILAYGKSNRNSNGEYLNFGQSGEAIRLGDGLFAQMEVSNTIYYNNFSLKLLEDALLELSATKLDFGERYFLIRTGERGAMAFHKAVLNAVSGWRAFAINDSVGVLKKVSSNLHPNALGAGFQFTEYYAPMGVRVKIEVDASYDDPVRNKILHPDGGPANSYRFDIMDIGSMDQPNVFKVSAKNCPEIRGYQYGMRNPFTGLIGGDSMSWDEDSAVMHAMTATGICVLDPTRTLSLVPNILLY